MSLQLWMPLNGDAHNQGVYEPSSITVGSSITYGTDGKIGKCVQCTTTTNNTITVTVPNLAEMLSNGKQYTLACWAKLTGTPSNGWVIKLGSNTCGLWWAKSAPRWVWNENDNGKRCANETVSADYTNWYHIAVTVDKTENGYITTKQYVNGVLANTYPGSRFASSSFAQPTGTNITIYPYVASLNDIRLYDTVLSPKEIKELARGLICHYPLNNEGLGNNTNILWDGCAKGGTNKGITATYEGYGWWHIYGTVTGSSSGYITLYGDDSASPNTPITNISGDYRISFEDDDGVIIANKIGFRYRIQSNVGTSSLTTFYTSPKEIVRCGRINAISLSMSASAQGTSVNGRIRIKAEAGTTVSPWSQSIQDSDGIVHDTSGYGRHGVVTGKTGLPNLLVDSYTMSTWNKGAGAAFDTATNDMGTIKLTGTSSNWTSVITSFISNTSLPYSTIQNKTVTISFCAKASAARSQAVAFSLAPSGATTYTARTKYYTFGSVSLKTNWDRYSITGTVTDESFVSGSGTVATTDKFFIEIYNHVDDFNVWIKGVKLEIGDTVTDYVPNSADAEYASFKDGMYYSEDSPRYGLSAKFNGGNQITCSNFDYNLGEWSASIWFYYASSEITSAQYLYTLKNSLSGTSKSQIYLDYSDEPRYNYMYEGTGYVVKFSKSDVADIVLDNAWNHFVFTYHITDSARTIRVYLNGQVINSQNFSGTQDIKLGKYLTIGGSNYNNYFKNKLSDFRFYSTALSADDIAELYNSGLTSLTNTGVLMTHGEFVETGDFGTEEK